MIEVGAIYRGGRRRHCSWSDALFQKGLERSLTLQIFTQLSVPEALMKSTPAAVPPETA